MTLPFSRDVRERPGYLFELYHENSKLNRSAGVVPMTQTAVRFSARSFRACVGSEEVELPELVANAFDHILGDRRSRRDLGTSLGISQLAALLNAGAGATGMMQEDDGPSFVLRAAPSAGGLNSVDVFIAIRDVIDLPAAVYYFHPLRNAIVRIENANRETIAGPGFFFQDWVGSASAIILLVANFARNSWKYGERGYRLALLDAGHLAQNILLKAEDLGCPACAIGGFHDQVIAQELSIDGVTEAVVHSIALGGDGDDLSRTR